ncbi:MAG: FKBP-type peptidyl-prolyl cis-trans isomerase [Opitutaceae bacterium]|nr:FKBP-type peptidyl-prolyl cis-trans isomerase [Verrucomicrobiales bacterium]
MKPSTLVAVATTLLTLSLSAADAPELKDPKDKVSYAFGMNIANNMKKQGIDINPEAVAAGMKDMMAGKTVLNESQAQQVLMSFQQEMMAKQADKAKVSGEKNKVEGEKFLAENKKKAGVKVLPGGVQYTVLKEGAGAMPKATDSVKTHYRGTLIDGTEFDSSYKRGEPAVFGVTQVIPGWTEALQQMKTGSKWQIVIPADKAYGANGSGADIGPNATLIFDIELLSIEKSAP